MLGGVGRCWEVLEVIVRCWEVLEGVGRCWEVLEGFFLLFYLSVIMKIIIGYD